MGVEGEVVWAGEVVWWGGLEFAHYCSIPNHISLGVSGKDGIGGRGKKERGTYGKRL